MSAITPAEAFDVVADVLSLAPSTILMWMGQEPSRIFQSTSATFGLSSLPVGIHVLPSIGV